MNLKSFFGFTDSPKGPHCG